MLDDMKTSMRLSGIYQSCTIVYMNTVDGKYGLLPVIINSDGNFCKSTDDFISAPNHRALSSSWKLRAVQSIARWKDFESAGGTSLDDFKYQLIQPAIDVETKTRPICSQSAQFISAVIERFLRHQFTDPAGDITPRSGDRPFSILRHLSTPGTTRVSRYPLNGRSKARPHSFPNDALEPFFRALVDGSSSEESATRNGLYFLLLAFSGLRMSEPLHLWTSDISVGSNLKPQVLFYHPVHGPISFESKDARTRREVLMSDFVSSPRNECGRASHEWCGWKGMLFEEIEGRRRRTRAYWSCSDAEQLFVRFHAAYLLRVRSRFRSSHPFYFVSLKSGSKGRPWTRAAARDVYDRAAAAIGLGRGTTMHSFRHAYAQNLRSRGVSPEVLQICLHHASLSSQAVYSRPGTAEVNRSLMATEASGSDWSPFKSDVRWLSDPLGLYPGVLATAEILK
jgi:integrase